MKMPGKTKYPKSLKIGKEEWKVIFKDKIEKDSQTVGLCEPNDKILYIKKGQSKKETFSTLVHECLHALEDEYGFELKHKHIYRLEQAIVALLVDNF